MSAIWPLFPSVRRERGRVAYLGAMYAQELLAPWLAVLRGWIPLLDIVNVHIQAVARINHEVVAGGVAADRIVFDKVLQVLRFGCSYQGISDTPCSATTIRGRRDEGIALGVFDQLARIARDAYDRIVGLRLDDVAVDDCGPSTWIRRAVMMRPPRCQVVMTVRTTTATSSGSPPPSTILMRVGAEGGELDAAEGDPGQDQLPGRPPPRDGRVHEEEGRRAASAVPEPWPHMRQG
jgi:hypothetical protein